MTFSNIAALFFLCLSLNTDAQNSWTDVIPPKAETNFKQYAALLINGDPMWDGESPSDPLVLTEMEGKLTVSAVDRKNNQPIKGDAIGFMVGVKDYETNSLWMVSDEIWYEIDLADFSRKASHGDVIVIMLVDKTCRLPRHEVLLGAGC